MSEYAVESGRRVRRGDVIGYVGASGLATGPHLHFEMMRGGQAIDPQRAQLGIASAIPAGEMAAIRGRVARLLAIRPA